MGKIRTLETGRRVARGFTLIELLVVLSIMVGMAAAFPLARDRLDPSRAINLYAALVRSDLRSSRADALAHAETTSVVFDADAHGYRLEPEGRDRTIPRSIEVRLLGDQASGGHSQSIAFRADGSSDGGLIVVSRPGVEARIRVSPLTGRAASE